VVHALRFRTAQAHPCAKSTLRFAWRQD